MMCTEDKMEEMVPSAEEEEKREEEMEENEDGEDEVKDEEAKPQATDKKTPLPVAAMEEEAKPEATDKKTPLPVAAKEGEAKPQATDKKTPLPVAAKEKKPDDVLNLNNEVVKMRKEVKRLRALIIRKLTRQIAALKKKKGKETEVESNQRRAARLLEEVHAMKSLSPDLVTKTALQKNLNFEQVCKNPKSNIADRAIARIATHPQFSKKIDSIKAAVKAFKEERMKGGKQGGKGKVQNQAGKATLPLPDKRGGKESQKNNEDKAVEQKEITDGEEGVDARKDTEDATVVETGKKIEKEIGLAGTADIQMQEMPESESVKPASVKSSDVKDTVENKTQNKAAEKKPSLKPAPAALQKTTADEESDLESSDDEEKEYFDDSTEERFHKQSSQSEESDDDDFFVGKVSTVKKKKKQSDVEGEEKVDKVGKDSTDKVKVKDKLQRELDELQSRLKPKAARLQSAFCSSLAGTKAGGGGGAGRGRGGDNKSRGQGKPKGSSGMNRDFSKPFQKQERGKEKNSGSKYSQLHPEGRRPPTEERGFASADRGRGRGRGGPPRQRDHRGGGFFSHQAPQQALHPSWEASKKRKEQQGQILAFQGKKIKFDDDD